MFKEMVLEKSGNRLNIPLMIMTLGASMLLAYSTLGGGPSPLNCALAAAVPPIYSAAVLAGRMLGLSAETVTGRGAGLDGAGLQRKRKVIAAALRWFFARCFLLRWGNGS